MPTIKHMRIFMSFHHICFRTRFAPRRKSCAEWARLSVLSCKESKCSPRLETCLMLSRMMPTVLSISWPSRDRQPRSLPARLAGLDHESLSEVLTA